MTVSAYKNNVVMWRRNDAIYDVVSLEGCDANTLAGVCSFSWNLSSFPVNSQKLGVQAPQNVEFE